MSDKRQDMIKDKIENGNEILKEFLNHLLNKKGDELVERSVYMDGLEVMCNKVLFGNMSSSQLLNRVFVENYGFNEVLSDLLWILDWKKYELNQFNKERMMKLGVN